MKGDRIFQGGKTVYGARIGILTLETKFPRIPGDVGNAMTWPFPVLYKVVRGATVRSVVHDKGAGISPALLDAAQELVNDGVDGIATTGGFLSIFQKQLASHVDVPVATSSLMQIPMVAALLPPGKRVGVLTVHGGRLSAEYLEAAGAPIDTPIVGTEDGAELSRVLIESLTELDFDRASDDVLAAGRKMMRLHKNIGALVLECHNMAPYSSRLQSELNVPVFDVYTFINWFHSGLSPRRFIA